MSSSYEVSFGVTPRARFAQLSTTVLAGGLAAVAVFWVVASFFEQAPPALGFGVLPVWVVGSAIHYVVSAGPRLRGAVRTVRFGDEGVTLVQGDATEFFAYAWLGTSLVAGNRMVLHDRTMNPVASIVLLDREARAQANLVAEKLERCIADTRTG